MKTILIATNNLGKFGEIKEVLEGLPFTFISLKDLKIKEDIEETGKTYEENAILKAEFFGKIANLPTLADDSGIVVEALKGELGVKTRRWGAGEKATDEEWLDFFLNRMENEKNRRAEFFTSIAFFDLEKTVTFNGACTGVLLKEQDGALIPGIPLTSYFVPDGYDRAYCNLGVEEKNKISHRGKSSLKARAFLEKLG